MRNILSPEQVASLVADVTVWMAHMAQASDDKDWQASTIYSLKQLAEIDEVEVYLVVLRFPSGDQSSYIVPFLLKRGADGSLASLGEYSFFPPDFTHPTQERERNA